MPRPRRPHRSWADLQPDLLAIILLNLTCLADRVYFSAVCRPWRSAAADREAPARQLPWLLLPSPAAPSFFSLHSGATRRLYLPQNVRGARLCGSHEGGWVALALEQWRGYAAVNLVSGAMVPLPDRLRTNQPILHGNNACEHHMVIHSITFSDVPWKAGCLAAAHVSSAFNIAFWRPGMDRYWIAYGLPMDVIQDMIYYRNELKEGFHVLSNTEDVVVYTPNGGPTTAPLVMSRSSYHVMKRADYKPDNLLHKSLKLSRYLVESRGKLLMVLRQLKWRRTFRFRIFEMNLEIAPGGGSEASWVEIHTLPGRLLLLGRGCSRAFEMSHFNRLDVGNIYYLDDTRSNISFALNSAGKYSSTDMGVYAQKILNRTDRTWRFPQQFTSECSPPIWFAP
ncbi:hypothetical protein QYE76_054447 [Lolium multiflorum]|uniref:KIB1-4 beta-propeller domain-containing protein n=1 Tax=Lolium multiflorum TaxID=4521 RepID=A0AAD8SZE6_LOLMU|nr:hypothetical protein QYE76_054447 [Lolium multiflorum]